MSEDDYPWLWKWVTGEAELTPEQEREAPREASRLEKDARELLDRLAKATGEASRMFVEVDIARPEDVARVLAEVGALSEMASQAKTAAWGARLAHRVRERLGTEERP